MILVDTTVWIDHLHRADARLARWLDQQLVLGHPFVQGELAAGHLRDRTEVLALFDRLPRAQVIEHASMLQFLEVSQLAGCGLGWVDLHLIASTCASEAELCTRDKPLARVARSLKIVVRD